MYIPGTLRKNSLLLRLRRLPEATMLSQMDLQAIVESIDAEIEILQRARALLNGAQDVIPGN
jgi:hypothetical protein